MAKKLVIKNKRFISLERFASKLKEYILMGVLKEEGKKPQIILKVIVNIRKNYQYENQWD